MAATLSSRLSAHFAPLHDHPTPDGDLLARYADHGDAAAFALLVKRHGGMVAAVCRKRLRHAQDAEDATQAVFLALARKAAKVHATAPVAAWLYGCAARACREVARRNRRKPWQPLTHDVPGDRAMSPDAEAVAAVLDEVAHLSDACRAAVVLCELEGVPRSVAARRLGVAEGTLSSRLAAARKTLGDRLARRGFAPTAAAVLTGLAAGTPAPAFDPPSLTPLVHQITEAIVSTGIAWKLKLLAATCVAGTTLAIGSAAGDGPPPAPAPTPVAAKAAKSEFVFATVVDPSKDEDDPPARPRALVIETLGSDGIPRPTRTIDPAALAARIPGLKAGEKKVIAADKFYVHPIEVGPDGRAMVFSALNPADVKNRTSPVLGPIVEQLTQRKQDTYLADPSGTVTKLSEWRNDAPLTVWSPDGGTLYQTAVDSTESLHFKPPFISPDTAYVTTRVEVATGKRQRLGLPRNARPLAAGPDGKTLLITTSKQSFFEPTESALWLAAVQDEPSAAAKLRPVGEQSRRNGYCDAVFSPDGKRAIVTDFEFVPYPKDLLRPNDHGTPSAIPLCPVRRFHLVDTTAGTITRIATQPSCTPDFGRSVRWSPDGSRIAFTDAKGWTNEEYAFMQVVEPRVVTCDPDGGNPDKVAMPTPKPEGFKVVGHGPQLIGWR